MSAQSIEAICSLALDKLGSGDVIVNIAAPVKSIERFLARQYYHLRDAELRKHRWLFSQRLIRITPTGSPVDNDFDGTLYRYTMPTNALRAVRQADTTWQVRGRELLDESSTYIDVLFVLAVDPPEMDELFVEALASKIAEVACEKVTNSKEKQEQCRADYDRAIAEARRVNAFERGVESYSASDAGFSWLEARYYG